MNSGVLDLHSEKIPEVTVQHDITYLFDFFAFNWHTISPLVYLLGGIFVGFYFLRKLKDNFF